jgi:UDP-galactopyranose mutase
MKTALIVGGGFAGCAMAHQFALARGWKVTLVEAGPSLGAGVRTQWRGGHPFTFGPRHFLTQNERVYAFLNSHLPMRSCADHEFITYVEQDEAFYNYPIHEDDIARMPETERIKYQLDAAPGTRWLDRNTPANFEEFWQYSIGGVLYDKFINQYSKKMWDVESNTALDTFKWSPKGVTIKSGPRAAWDTAISAYPESPFGYDDYFALSTAKACVLLNTTCANYSLAPHQRAVKINGEWQVFDAIVSTISPDALFNYTHGKLPFMGRDIETLILPVEFALPPHVYFCYYAGRERFTRVTEYKKFTRHKSASTLITIEYPSHKNKLYPMPFKSEQERAAKYFAMLPERCFSIGRAGSYDYAIDIDDCIAQAMDVIEKLK